MVLKTSNSKDEINNKAISKTDSGDKLLTQVQNGMKD